MTRNEVADANSMHLEYLPVSLLQPHPDNDYPIVEAELAELIDSIRAEGLAQPPLVRPIGRGYQIISGHRRVESFRRLAQEDAFYGTIPANVLEGCDDERALVLLDVTNLMMRQLSPLERARRFERLWKVVPELRRKSPELRGVRTSQVIADIITRETGESISRASVDRALASGRRAQEVRDLVESYGDVLIHQWAGEFQGREGFDPAVVKDIACRDAKVQHQLWDDYQREGMTPKQLARLLTNETRKTDVDVERALDQVIKTLREVSAWVKKDGAGLDTYRVDYIRRQLDKLGR